jgi:predicted ferric reductase
MQEDEILILKLKPKHTAISFLPGQFGFLSVRGVSHSREEHPFSVMEIYPDSLIFGIKIVGNFTLGLKHLTPGSLLTVRGPYGSFGEKAASAPSQVWIAGGIGITPFLSLLASLNSTQTVTLYYCFRQYACNYFLEKFRGAASHLPLFTFAPCDSAKGTRLSAKTVMQDPKVDPERTYFFLCGPSVMMENFKKELHALGVPRKHIIFEDFALK